MSKQYGLIIPSSKQSRLKPAVGANKASIFGSDSDSDEPESKKITSHSPGANEKRKARKIQEKALEEDPTVYQYDELYDDIESKRTAEKQEKSKDARKAKYISKLLECAERRKLENERRLERTVQKEREKEGEEFADKESFVTSAYRKKLDELKQAEEREKREDYLEAIGDVTKQQDLGGFYRHLYEQKLKTKEERDEINTSKDVTVSSSVDRTSPENKVQSKSNAKSRAYRKRHSSDDEGESTIVKKGTSKKSHLQSNLDADSDFSIDDSSDSGSENDENSRSKENPTIQAVDTQPIKQEPVLDKQNSLENGTNLDSDDRNGEQSEVNDTKASIKEEPELSKDPPVEIKPKKDIWKKRTVGEVYDAALQRYYERKAARKG